MTGVEEWRPCPAFEGWYEVSDLGRVRRIKTAGGNSCARVLLPTVNSKGYPHVGLCIRGKQRTLRIHRLVAEAFYGPPGDRHTNHKNGVKSDNRLENLEWCSRSENALHAYRTGLTPRYRNSELPSPSADALNRPATASAVQAMIDRHHAAKLDYQAAALVPYITAAS